MGWTFYNASGEALTSFGPVALTDLDIDGGTDIGAAIVDADLFIVDDGAGGTNRKTAASRIVTYVGANTDTRSGSAKAWCKWEATGTHSILGSYGWTSITDGGAAGDTDHTLSVTFDSINNQVFAGATDDARFISIGPSAAGTVTTRVYVHDGTASDVDRNMLVAFGDLA